MLTFFFVRLSLLSFFGYAIAQNLDVDTNWRKFSNSRSRSERIKTAQDALSSMNSQLKSNGEFNGIGYWQSGNIYSAMALQDQISKTTANKNAVLKNLKLVFNRLGNKYDQFGWWAQAAIYAHNAYGDQELLSNAISTWNSVTRFVVSEAEAQSKKHPLKSFAIASSCGGSTMAGGVFWRPTKDDQAINSITTGLYLTLSSYLAEITKDSRYKNAAILSAKWIRSHNINANNIILDSVNGHDCSRSPSTWIFTYNSGKFIEGLSVLFDVTKDSQWNTLMVKIVASAVKNTSWQGKNGIITEGSNNASNNDGIGFKAVFIRGLREAFRRTPENAKLRTLLHSYIDVQYNALLDLAKKGNFYSANWQGPPGTTFTAWGQLAAVDVLTAAVEVN